MIVTSLYVLVAVTALGVQPAAEFGGQEAGLATILQNLTGSDWPALVLACGAVISVFSVTLVVLYGQTRILFAMSRDGLLPELFYRVNPHTLSPVACTIVVAIFVACIAAFVPDAVLWELTSMGTLVAFMVVSTGVIMLGGRRGPDMPRGFRVPFYPVLPLLSIASCIYLVCNLNPADLPAVRGLAGDRRHLLSCLQRAALAARACRQGDAVKVPGRIRRGFRRRRSTGGRSATGLRRAAEA